MIHLLTLRSIDALEQCGDEAFLDLKLGFEGGDLFGQFGDLLLWSLDESNSAWRVPTCGKK